MIIFAIDALEFEKVMEYDCKNLRQLYFGKTNIDEFSQARTMVLWSSFMTGENKENEVLVDGNEEMWNVKWNLGDTFFSKFNSPVILDLPGYSYNLEEHEKSRKLLKKYFEVKLDDEKQKILKEYNQDAFDHHKKIKDNFFKSLKSGEHDLVLGYFSIIDVIGHLNFGNNILMKMLYKEMDEMAANLKQYNCKILIISDHGMVQIGRFGDHSNYGFWSTNFKVDFDNPKITDFYGLIKNTQ